MVTFGLLVMSIGCIDNTLKQHEDPPEEGIRTLEVAPTAIDYGMLDAGASAVDTVTITSTGTVPVTLSDVRVTGSGAFTITSDFADTELAPGESLDVVVTYTSASSDDEGTLEVDSDATEPRSAVALVGAGLFPAISVDPASLTLRSNAGETVHADVTVSSVGTADLDLSGMTVQGDQFSADAPGIPDVLAPGESTVVTVSYTPSEQGEDVTGKLWFTTNTASGFAVVPLEGIQEPECMGLGEAWDRGLMTATLNSFAGLHVTDLSTDTEICIDDWYVYLSETSQDMGAGDMNGDVGNDYPHGSKTLSPRQTIAFPAAETSGPSWWCMELTQYTQSGAVYEFTGARVPEPLKSWMLAGDQDSVWAWMDANPVMLAMRGTNWFSVPEGGGSSRVTMRVLNMGSRNGVAEVRETVPAGWTATDFSQDPIREEAGEDGATVYVFSVALDARVLTGEYEDTIYDETSISYTLATPACIGRQYLPPMQTTWADSDGTLRTDTANPLVVSCES